MSKKHYNVGDKIVLKGGTFRSGRAEDVCSIVSIMPSAYGLSQYRVRFEAENCERRITSDDIDHLVSVTPARAPDLQASRRTDKGSWINGSAIKVGK